MFLNADRVVSVFGFSDWILKLARELTETGRPSFVDDV